MNGGNTRKIFKFLTLMVLCLGLWGCNTPEDVQMPSSGSVLLENDNNGAYLTPSEQEEHLQIEEERERGESPEEFPEDGSFSVRFYDVGQADAALVECDGHYMLIDGGNKGDSSLIYSALKELGVSELDIVVGTHAHEDHIGGISGAFNYAESALTLCPVRAYDSAAFEDFKKYADKNGGGITVPQIGDTYSLGSATVEILGLNAAEDANNTSIILKIAYGETSFLFMGDAEREAEEVLLSSGADLSATVLKVGHHGSGTSSTYPLLREVMPKYAIISVGRENEYGHPMDSTLSKLRDAGAEIFRTDIHGDIVVTSDGKNVSVAVENTATEEEIMTPGEDYGLTEGVAADYIVNRNSKKLHFPDCESVEKMSEKNKEYLTGTREEFTAQGYEPCAGCRP